MEGNTTSEFPRYSDGDVLVTIGPVKRYQLHANVLRRNSVYFQQLLTPARATQLSSRARKEGATIIYHLDLVKDQAGGDGSVGTLNLKQLDSNGRQSIPMSLNFLENENGKVPNDEYKYWDWLFGIFYHRAPQVNDTNIVYTLGDCMGIIDIAESIGAINSVRESIDLALLRYGSVLYDSIAANPMAWADLSRRVHSPTIYVQAIVHMVGKWNMLTEDDKEDLHPYTREIAERKYKELNVAKEVIELRILGHYPQHLTRNVNDKPGRPAYANDIYLWMCLCFFRQWFAQAISDGRNRPALDGGFDFYSKLHAGGKAYLDHEEFQQFHQYFPMSAKACNILEANMNILKEEVKHFTKDLCTNRSNVDPKEFDLKWLTCTVVNKEDLPWANEEENQQTKSLAPDRDGLSHNQGSGHDTTMLNSNLR